MLCSKCSTRFTVHVVLSTLCGSLLCPHPQPLQNRSQDGIAFLEGLGLNIGTIVRLGGHSKPRTCSNPAGPNVGTYLVKAVAARVQAAANVEVKLNTKVCMRCHL
jgi:hypothetical protein